MLRLLTESMMTYKELASRTGLSESKIKNLVCTGEEDGFIQVYTRIQGFRIGPGKKLSEKKTGRPEVFCLLTGKAKWLLRLDPEIRDHWPQEGVTYEKVIEHTDLDSYQDLEYAIRKHPKLSKYRVVWDLMGEELQGVLLRPFIIGNRYKSRETILYDDLVEAIRKNVRTDHVLPYYFVLRNSFNDITEVLECNRLLLRKMEELPEVQAYLRKKIVEK